MTAPAIAIFAYCRSAHLSKILHSLQRQTIQTALPIHLFLDGPRSSKEAVDIHACRMVAQEFSGVFNLTIHASTVNRGLYDSLTSGISEVLASHEQVIVVEDDIFMSPYFLAYMLDALNLYASEPRVASIHGYLPPMTRELPETFFLRGADCWGWATWRDRWALYRHDAGLMASEIRSQGLARAFDLGGRVPNLRLLDARAAGRSKSWAICWHASCFLADRYTLHPGHSLVRNIGLDHSGEHCLPSLAMEARLSQQPVVVRKQPIVEDPDIVSAYARQIGRQPFPRRLLNKMRGTLLNLLPTRRHGGRDWD